jgi:2-octaprenylphenol hydroxylase
MTLPILINGGGMVGLALALALAEAGLGVHLLEAQAAPLPPGHWQALRAQADFEPRVSAITLATERLLRRLGVWEPLVALRTSPYRDMRVWDAEGTGHIHFAAEEVQCEALGHIVENRLLCSVLAAALAAHPLARCDFGRGLHSAERSATGDWNVVCDDGTVFKARLLLGADGASSVVRELAGVPTRRWSYQQRALVCTLRSTRPHAGTAFQRFLPSGPLALLPLCLPGAETQCYSSLVWSCDTALADELLGLPEPAFLQQLTHASEGVLGEIESATARSALTLQQQHAVDYVAPGLALVGDAAHTIHPLAGQGVNLGFADVESLVAVLEAAERRGEALASLPVLTRYQRQRKGPNLGMMLAMEAFKRSFGSDALTVRWLRNAGLRLAAGSLPLKRALIRQAMGLSG